MIRWLFPLRFSSGLDTLTAYAPTVNWTADGPRLRIEITSQPRADAGASTDPLLHLLNSFRRQGFEACGTGGGISTVPPPWQLLVEPRSVPEPETLLAAELCVELWLTPSKGSSDLEALRGSISARGDQLVSDVHEALAYWLLASRHDLGGRADLKQFWRNDTTDVLVMRASEWRRSRRPMAMSVNTSRLRKPTGDGHS